MVATRALSSSKAVRNPVGASCVLSSTNAVMDPSWVNLTNYRQGANTVVQNSNAAIMDLYPLSLRFFSA